MVTESTRRQQHRAAQARYRVTGKGKAANARYVATTKCKEVQLRYRSSPKGTMTLAVCNARRLFIGDRYVGRATIVEEARAINGHIKERLIGFKQRFSARAEAQGVPAGAVSPEAIP
jgi:hypothetical protein